MAEAKTKTPLTEEQKQRRRVGRALARANYLVKLKADNPEMSKADLANSWKKAAKTETRFGMRSLKRLEKAGYVVVPPAPKEGKEA